mmetsp:Transcript_32578/g.75361  ORF Transcript_32578/g.75361 Transcript_32578/m.75361 type:complete len:366 (+) Transcript_32578:629-1726(+)
MALVRSLGQQAMHRCGVRHLASNELVNGLSWIRSRCPSSLLVPRRSQEVVHNIVVDLEKCCRDFKGPTLRPQVLDLSEDEIHRARDDASLMGAALPVFRRPVHGVSLPASSLPIREDGHAISVHGRLHQHRELLEHILLTGCWVKHLVEGEVPLIRLLRESCNTLHDAGSQGQVLLVWVVHLRRLMLLPWQLRPNAAENSDIAFQVEEAIVQGPRPRDVLRENLRSSLHFAPRSFRSASQPRSPLPGSYCGGLGSSLGTNQLQHGLLVPCKGALLGLNSFRKAAVHPVLQGELRGQRGELRGQLGRAFMQFEHLKLGLLLLRFLLAAGISCATGRLLQVLPQLLGPETLRQQLFQQCLETLLLIP